MTRHAKLIAGNWKMNGLPQDGKERAADLAARVRAAEEGGFKMLVCPPFTLLADVAREIAGSGVFLGGQDCHERDSGAFTGDISAQMLKEAGCTHVILGHSERRQYHAETSLQVAAKARAAHAAGLVAVICVGETDAERESGFAQKVVGEQLKESLPETATAENTVVAYEPVWAIGTGKSATAQDVSDMHAFIRDVAGDKAILYGGSVKGSNAQEILHLPNVDGVLVGGASLKPDEFWQIAAASSGA